MVLLRRTHGGDDYAGEHVDDTGNADAPPPDVPPRPTQPPPAPVTASRGDRSLVLRVNRRMLWVGSAAIPLHNITWVDAFKWRPDWRVVVARFIAALFCVVLLYIGINAADGGDARVGDSSPPLLFVILVLVVTLWGVFRSKPMLVIEMASGSRVTVTLPSMDELRQIAGWIAYAIENPTVEFTTVVQQHNTNNYGPVVNMNNGRGNTGFRL